MEKEKIIEEVVNVVRRYLPEEEFRVLLFGSWAKESADPTSDIDIGVLGKKPVDEWVLMRIRGEADAIPTLRKIDIVDLGAVDDKFRAGVLSYAKSL